MVMILKNLRAIRRKSLLTQRQVADKLGIHCTTYTKYETGNSEPSLDVLVKLADMFDVTTDYLLERTDRPHLPRSEATLSSDEEDFLAAYRAASSDDKAIIDIIVRRYTRAEQAKNPA